jgi:hypothetical protein
MNGLITDLIVWLSPFLAAGFLWFLHNHIIDVKNEITQVKGQIGGLKEDIIETSISLAKIQTDIEHIKKHDKIDEGKVVQIFEDNIVKVIRRARTRFD